MLARSGRVANTLTKIKKQMRIDLALCAEHALVNWTQGETLRILLKQRRADSKAARLIRLCLQRQAIFRWQQAAKFRSATRLWVS